MFGDLDWPLNASRGFVSVSWASGRLWGPDLTTAELEEYITKGKTENSFCNSNRSALLLECVLGIAAVSQFVILVLHVKCRIVMEYQPAVVWVYQWCISDVVWCMSGVEHKFDVTEQSRARLETQLSETGLCVCVSVMWCDVCQVWSTSLMWRSSHELV